MLSILMISFLSLAGTKLFSYRVSDSCKYNVYLLDAQVRGAIGFHFRVPTSNCPPNVAKHIVSSNEATLEDLIARKSGELGEIWGRNYANVVRDNSYLSAISNQISRLSTSIGPIEVDLDGQRLLQRGLRRIDIRTNLERRQDVARQFTKQRVAKDVFGVYSFRYWNCVCGIADHRNQLPEYLTQWSHLCLEFSRNVSRDTCMQWSRRWDEAGIHALPPNCNERKVHRSGFCS